MFSGASTFSTPECQVIPVRNKYVRNKQGRRTFAFRTRAVLRCRDKKNLALSSSSIKTSDQEDAKLQTSGKIVETLFFRTKQKVPYLVSQNKDALTVVVKKQVGRQQFGKVVAAR